MASFLYLIIGLYLSYKLVDPESFIGFLGTFVIGFFFAVTLKVVITIFLEEERKKHTNKTFEFNRNNDFVEYLVDYQQMVAEDSQETINPDYEYRITNIIINMIKNKVTESRTQVFNFLETRAFASNKSGFVDNYDTGVIKCRVIYKDKYYNLTFQNLVKALQPQRGILIYVYTDEELEKIYEQLNS